MSFIVKGLDIPNQGEILRIEVDYDGTIWWDDGREYHELEDSAIQIPKGHGRLIDVSKRGVKNGWIIEAPTILEKEE